MYCACANPACLYEKESCGCCLMKKQIYRMEAFFNLTQRELKKDLMLTKLYIEDMRGERHVCESHIQGDHHQN